MVKISGFQIAQFRKDGVNNGTKVVSKEAIRMHRQGHALLWLYAWRNEAGNPTFAFCIIRRGGA